MELMVVNPEGLGDMELMIVNPGPEDAPEVWRALRQRFSPEVAAACYLKVYPEKKKKVKRNKGKNLLERAMEHPDFDEMNEMFYGFHGRYVTEDDLKEIDLPQLGDDDIELLLMALGEAPAESYQVDDVVESSSKAGNVWVHPYESPDGKKPLKVVTADGELIMTLPGNHKVTDFIRG